MATDGIPQYQQPQPENSFNEDADVEDNDEEEVNVERKPPELSEPDETGQNWLLRHLRSHLSINTPDRIITDFVMQQVTVLKCLYVSLGCNRLP
jgi:hypothetical protein